MAEEDLIWGKKMGYFGGIEPDNMQKFIIDDNNRMTAILPPNTKIDGKHICTVAGADIVYKMGSYPKNPKDGILYKTITESIFKETVSNSSDKYWAAFPFSTQGVYNQSKIYTATQNEIYGFDIDQTDPNPATRVSYPKDVINHGWTPGDHGDNSDFSCFYTFRNYTKMNKIWPRYYFIANGNGNARYVNLNDLTSNYNGDFIHIGIPKIYVKRWVENNTGVYHFRCSLTKIDNSYQCVTHINDKLKEIDYIYHSVGCRTGTYGSWSVKFNTNPQTSILIGDCQYPSGGITSTDYPTRLLINDLLILVFKNTDIESVFGEGNTSGSMVKNGASFAPSYTETDGALFCRKYANNRMFGIEGWGSNVRTWMAGIYSYNKYVYVGPNWISIHPTNTEHNKYIHKLRISNNITGYQTTWISGDNPTWWILPIVWKGGGTNTTYYSQYVYLYTNSQYVACAGGYWYSDTAYGPFYLRLYYSPSYTYGNLGSYLLYKPLV